MSLTPKSSLAFAWTNTSSTGVALRVASRLVERRRPAADRPARRSCTSATRPPARRAGRSARSGRSLVLDRELAGERAVGLLRERRRRPASLTTDLPVRRRHRRRDLEPDFSAANGRDVAADVDLLRRAGPCTRGSDTRARACRRSGRSSTVMVYVGDFTPLDST